jgi:hypothetical protein
MYNTGSVVLVRFNQNQNISTNLAKIRNMKFQKNASSGGRAVLCGGTGMVRLRQVVAFRSCFANEPNYGNCSWRFSIDRAVLITVPKDSTQSQVSPLSKEDCTTPYVELRQFCHKQRSVSGETVACLFDTLCEVSLWATSFCDLRNFRRNPWSALIDKPCLLLFKHFLFIARAG